MALEPPRLCVIAFGRRSIARRLVRSASRRKDVTQLSRSAWRTGKVDHVIPGPQQWTRVRFLPWSDARRRHGAGAGILRSFVDRSIGVESRIRPRRWRRAGIRGAIRTVIDAGCANAAIRVVCFVADARRPFNASRDARWRRGAESAGARFRGQTSGARRDQSGRRCVDHCSCRQSPRSQPCWGDSTDGRAQLGIRRGRRSQLSGSSVARTTLP
jgi:hypothetical protein